MTDIAQQRPVRPDERDRIEPPEPSTHHLTHGENTVHSAPERQDDRSALTDLHDQVDDLAGNDTIPCQEDDPELWFAESPDDVEFAKALCGSCPVMEQCLAGAVERREPWGVWGGQLFINGGIVARKRPRGRPRKHPVAA